jgi:hypothetical protein
LTTLQALLADGLASTAAAWPAIRQAYRWVHRLAHVLTHPGRRHAAAMRRRVGGVLGALARGWPTTGRWPAALRQFRKVTRSYWPGLFYCYDDPEVPRTNNDLEHFFGVHRYHERRASGRRRASRGTVVRGAVRVVAAAATRVQPVAGTELPPNDLQSWRSLRRELTRRGDAHTLGRRFRQHPLAYLRTLEHLLFAK